MNGEFRPNVKTHFFLPPFDVKLSLLPLMNWGLLPAGGESVAWHEQTPSNSLILTWHNALYNRDVNCPTNFQAELFADGRFDYRYPDHTIRYAPDWIVTNGLPTSLVCTLVATNYDGIVMACLGDAEYTFDWDNVLVKVWTVDHENDE